MWPTHWQLLVEFGVLSRTSSPNRVEVINSNEIFQLCPLPRPKLIWICSAQTCSSCECESWLEARAGQTKPNLIYLQIKLNFYAFGLACKAQSFAHIGQGKTTWEPAKYFEISLNNNKPSNPTLCVNTISIITKGTRCSVPGSPQSSDPRAAIKVD